jgi:hypothetical protein
MTTLDELRAAAAAGRAGEALDQIARIEASGYSDASLLVLKAIALQMAGGDDALEVAGRTLREAAARAEDLPDAHIECGWFVYNVEDDATSAIGHFERAIEALSKQIVSALSGAAKAIREAKSNEEAAKFLRTAADRILDRDALSRALDEP